MKTITKVSKLGRFIHSVLIIAIISMSHSAGAQWIETTPSQIQQDCHNYTGCGVIITKQYYIHRYHYKRYCGYPVQVVYPDGYCSDY